jgi:hypothetical protein
MAHKELLGWLLGEISIGEFKKLRERWGNPEDPNESYNDIYTKVNIKTILDIAKEKGYLKE